jgi:hypothetical protein
MTWEGFAAVVSVVALFVSVWTAYLQSFRRGALVVARPRAVLVEESAVTEFDLSGNKITVTPAEFAQRWELPLAFANTGVRPRAIEDLRLRTTFASRTRLVPLAQLRPNDVRGEGRPILPSIADLASPMIVQSDSAVERHAIFLVHLGSRELQAGRCSCAIEYRALDAPDTWKTGVTFEVVLPAAAFFESNHSTLIPITSGADPSGDDSLMPVR